MGGWGIVGGWRAGEEDRGQRGCSGKVEGGV